MKTEVSVETVVQIVESIFITTMDLEVVPVEVPWQPNRERLTSSVYLKGEWNGAISIECDRNQACEFAGRFSSSEPPADVDEDVRDMLGELTNIIGGNIKSVMDKKVSLSVPSVVDGSNYGLSVSEGEAEDRIAFLFSGGTFWVTVAAKDDPAQRCMISECAELPRSY